MKCAARERWKGYRKVQNFCPDCGISITRKSKRCASCAARKRHENEDYRKERSELYRRLWKNEEFKNGVIVGVKNAHKRGDYDQKYSEHSEKMRTAWKRGVYDNRPRLNAEQRVLRSLEIKRRWESGIYDTEEYRLKLSHATKRRWEEGFYDEIFDDAEIKSKLSEATKGRWERGELGGAAWRKKLSDTMKSRWADPEYHRSHTGENHPRWKGGISDSPYASDFNDNLKREIRARDEHLCAMCNEPEKGECHIVHHVDYDKMNSDPFNLLALCRKCHAQTNYNRSYWQVVLTPIARGAEMRKNAFICLSNQV